MVQRRGSGRTARAGGAARPPRRATSWFLDTTVADNSAAAGSLVDFEMASDLAVDERKGATVTRIRGEMVLRIDARGGLSSQVIWYAGMIVGHENLLTTLPDPELDDADWMWYQTGYLVPQSIPNDASNADLVQGVVRYINIDNRSQRKMLSEESRMNFVFKNDLARTSR